MKIPTRILTLLLLFCVGGTDVGAQSPYELDRSDVALTGVGIVLLATDRVLAGNTDPLTLEEIKGLSRDDVFALDRFVTYNYSESAATASDILEWTAILAPLALFTSPDVRSDFSTVGLMYLQTALFSVGTFGVTKGGVTRPRPYVYNENVPIEEKLHPDAKRSFFSGHTTISFSSAVFLSKVYGDYFPDSKWKPYIWGVSLGIAAAVGYLRIAAGKHFLTDVLVGALVGGAIGYLIPKIHETSGNGQGLIYPEGPAPNQVAFQFTF
jgi:membrane-associated phospholipid phosphatase